MAKAYLGDDPLADWSPADTEDVQSFLESSESGTVHTEKVFGSKMDKIKRCILARALSGLISPAGREFLSVRPSGNVVARSAQKRLAGNESCGVLAHP